MSSRRSARVSTRCKCPAPAAAPVPLAPADKAQAMAELRERTRVCVRCPHLVAAASWTMERLTGTAASQAAQWDWQEVAAALQVPPAKYGRLLTLQDAIRAAVRNWPGNTRSTV